MANEPHLAATETQGTQSNGPAKNPLRDLTATGTQGTQSNGPAENPLGDLVIQVALVSAMIFILIEIGGNVAAFFMR